MIPIINLFGGVAIGSQYSAMKSKEREFHQGSDFFVATFFQVLQMGAIGTVARRLNSLFPGNPFSWPVTILTNVIPFIAIPLQLFYASVAQHTYSGIAMKVNGVLESSGFSRLQVPTQLSAMTTRVIRFLAEHTGNILGVALIIGAVALIVLGNPFFGAGILAGLIYSEAARRGWIPLGMSAFIERHATVLSLIASAIFAPLAIQVITFVMLWTYIPVSKRFVQYKIDVLYHKIAKLFYGEGDLKAIQRVPLLEESEALNRPENLSEEEMGDILRSSDDQLMINPAHFTEELPLPLYPRNDEFKTYLTLMDTVNWSALYDSRPAMRCRLMDDDHFRQELLAAIATSGCPQGPSWTEAIQSWIDGKGRAPGYESQAAKTDRLLAAQARAAAALSAFQQCIEALAMNKQQSPGDYVADWLKRSMATFVTSLSRELGTSSTTNVASGTLAALQSARNAYSIILPHLLFLQTQIASNELSHDKQRNAAVVALEDMLLKIALESGEQCLLALDRTGADLLRAIGGEQADFVGQLKVRLHTVRSSYVEGLYSRLQNRVSSLQLLPSITTEGRHLHAVYHPLLSLGFLPLNAHDRDSIGITQLIAYEQLAPLRGQALYKDYTITTIHDELKRMPFADFMLFLQQKFRSNSKLNAGRPDALYDQFLSDCVGPPDEGDPLAHNTYDNRAPDPNNSRALSQYPFLLNDRDERKESKNDPVAEYSANVLSKYYNLALVMMGILKKKPTDSLNSI